MQIDVQDLMKLIGEQAVELYLLRKQVADLQSFLATPANPVVMEPLPE